MKNSLLQEQTHSRQGQAQPAVQLPQFPILRRARWTTPSRRVRSCWMAAMVATIWSTPADAKTTAPDELRGTSIRNGETRQIAKGDVIVVPNGVPHQFLEVTNPFLYYVVKVR